ncbi:MAG: nucleoside 2-deoxyribosyltransferase [bacterium]|jgi:nucleoside 2-deoxyribosyltransferase
MEDSKKIVYCSGPMFSDGNLWEMEQINNVLEGVGYTTYLPQRDGLEVKDVMDLLKNPLLRIFGDQIMALVRKAIYALDIYQVVDRSNYLVINLNGATPDGGSIVEASVFYTCGKPILCYKHDPRALFAGYDNPMISGLSYTFDTPVDDFQKIPEALTTIIQYVEAAGKYEYQPQPLLKKWSDLGKTIWEILETLRHPKQHEESKAKLLIELLNLVREYQN